MSLGEESNPDATGAATEVGGPWRPTPKRLKVFNRHKASTDPSYLATRHSFRPVKDGKLILLAECIDIPAPIAPEDRTAPKPKVPPVEMTRDGDYFVIKLNAATPDVPSIWVSLYRPLSER